jgi:hypothetical protein
MDQSNTPSCELNRANSEIVRGKTSINQYTLHSTLRTWSKFQERIILRGAF